MEYVKLQRICDIKNGFAFRSKNYSSSGIRIMRITNVQKGVLVDDNPKYYPEKDFSGLTQYSLSEKDLLVSLTGNVGRVGMMTKDFLPAALNQRVACLRIKEKESTPAEYLFYFLNSNFFERTCIENANGIAQLNLSTNFLKEVEIPLFKTETQKKIVKVLDKAQKLIDTRKEQIKLLDDLIQSVFYDMFGDPVLNPKGWDIKKLSEVTSKITDGKHGDCTDEENSGYYFIGAREINNGVVNYQTARQIIKEDFFEVDRRTNLQIGDLLIVNTGATIGKTAIIKNIKKTRKTIMQKSVAVIKPIRKYLDVTYLKFIYSFEHFTKSSSGSAQQNLLLSQMRATKIPVPPFYLQNQFAEKVIKIETQKEKLQQSLSELENNYNSLMQRAFKGELYT